MSTYISYDDLVLSTPDVEGYWRLDEVGPLFPDRTGKAEALDLAGASAQSAALFGYSQARYIGDWSESTSLPLNAQALARINAAQQLSIVLWMVRRPGPGTSAERAMFAIFAGSPLPARLIANADANTYTTYLGNSAFSGGLLEGVPMMFAVTLDGSDRRWIVNLGQVMTGSGAWANLERVNFLNSSPTAGLGVGHLSIYSRALTAAELQEQYVRRLFQGRIAGTVKLDDEPTAGAIVRSHRRSDGHVAGMATSEADGSYELTVTDNVQMDLLAIPPDGSGARPLAHGPILPEPIEQ